MPRWRIPFKTGYRLLRSVNHAPWDERAFDRAEHQLHKILPKGPLDSIHPDDLYFAARFYFQAGNQSGQRKHHVLAKRYFAAAVRNVGDRTRGEVLDWQSWLWLESGTLREKAAARQTLWNIIKHANISDAEEAATTLTVTTRNPRVKAKATATALARYEKVCKTLRFYLRSYTKDAEFEERMRAQDRAIRARARKKRQRSRGRKTR